MTNQREFAEMPTVDKKRNTYSRISKLKRQNAAESRKQKKIHKALMSGETLYDKMWHWASQVSLSNDMHSFVSIRDIFL